MSNGYGRAMRIFTKVSKVPFSQLRSKGFVGFLSVVFVDDSSRQGNTYEACLYNIERTIELLQNVGFTIHPTKSILTLTQRTNLLGFVIHSFQMTLEITKGKKNKIHNLKLLYGHYLVSLAILLLASLRSRWDYFFIEMWNIKK